MIVDIIDDSKQGGLSYHRRGYIFRTMYDYNNKRLKLEFSNDDIVEFMSVALHDVQTDSVTFKGLTIPASGSGLAPQSRIINMTFAARV